MRLAYYDSLKWLRGIALESTGQEILKGFARHFLEVIGLHVQHIFPHGEDDAAGAMHLAQALAEIGVDACVAPNHHVRRARVPGFPQQLAKGAPRAANLHPLLDPLIRANRGIHRVAGELVLPQ